VVSAILLTGCSFMNVDHNDRVVGEVMGRSGITLEEASPAELRGSISRDAAVAIAAADADLGVAAVTSASLGRMSATPPGGPELQAHPIVWVVVWRQGTSSVVRIVDANTHQVLSRGSVEGLTTPAR
jgi:hypothetical protein